jgi:hypothetical protein
MPWYHWFEWIWPILWKTAHLHLHTKLLLSPLLAGHCNLLHSLSVALLSRCLFQWQCIGGIVLDLDVIIGSLEACLRCSWQPPSTSEASSQRSKVKKIMKGGSPDFASWSQQLGWIISGNKWLLEIQCFCEWTALCDCRDWKSNCFLRWLVHAWCTMERKESIWKSFKTVTQWPLCQQVVWTSRVGRLEAFLTKGNVGSHCFW